jgi:predicted acyl esterase
VLTPEYTVSMVKDVRVPMRDGSFLAADIFHPRGSITGEKFPVLMCLGAYLKDLQYLPHGTVFTHQERPEPEWWVPRGYILIFVDSRGTGKSPGETDIWSTQEARVAVLPHANFLPFASRRFLPSQRRAV